MALTATQKVNIRMYLGWQDRFHNTDSRLEMALAAADTNAELLTTIGALLTSLADIDTKLADAHKRLKATKLGSIDLPGPGEIGMLRSEGRRFVGRLSSLLGVATRHDVFSGYGPTHYAGYDGPYRDGSAGGGGNLPPLG